jgi:hypothetical protein
MLRAALAALFAALLALALAPTPAVPRDAGQVAPFRVAAFDTVRRLDVNRLDFWTSNLGWLGVDPVLFGGGLRFPRGTPQSVIFASGLWVGARVQGTPRVTVAEYTSEWQPGRIVGGVPEPPTPAALRNWKMLPLAAFRGAEDSLVAVLPGGGGDADPLRHEAWSAYRELGGPTGTPLGLRTVPDPASPGDSVRIHGPDLPGELALWSVFNDANPAAHTNHAGASAPLGLEVEQAVYAFAGAPNSVAFVRWTIFHRGTSPLDSTYVTFWVDPDLGGSHDDLVGWDSTLQMGYVYNATNADAVYGARPPAVGVQLLGGSTGNDAGAFNRYVGDPASAPDSYRLIQGLQMNGDPWIDPTSSRPTRFPFAGDPVTGAGWLDANPSDRRMMVSVRPFPLVPGGSVQYVFAVVVGQGVDRLDSIVRMRCQAGLARDVAGNAFHPIFPARLARTEATATATGVRLAWTAQGAEPRALGLRRHAGSAVEPWPDTSEPVAQLLPDSTGRLEFAGPVLPPGERWTYGLFDPCDPLRPLDEATLEGPGAPLSFRIASPVARGAPRLFFTLPSAGTTRLQAFSATGRRLLDVDLGILPHGSQTRVLAGTETWPPGLYFFRLSQAGATRTARAVFLRPGRPGRV